MDVDRKIETKTTRIWIDDEGVLVLKHREGAELDVESVKACFEAYDQLGIGPDNKVLQLIDARDATMTTEARAFSAERRKHYFIAAAIISDSLAVRLAVNFFTTFYRPGVPFKMFSTETAAREWLRTFKK